MRPQVRSSAERAYELLEPFARADAENGYPLLRLLDGLMAGVQPAWELAESPGAARLLDPSTMPVVWLPSVGQWVGARLRGGMTEAQRRAEVSAPTGWTAGMAAELADVARQHMKGMARVRIRWRYDPDEGSNVDSSGHLLVRVHADDVRPGEENELIRDVEDAIPAHLLAHVQLSTARTYDDGREQFTDYVDLRASVADYDDLKDD